MRYCVDLAAMLLRLMPPSCRVTNLLFFVPLTLNQLQYYHTTTQTSQAISNAHPHNIAFGCDEDDRNNVVSSQAMLPDHRPVAATAEATAWANDR